MVKILLIDKVSGKAIMQSTVTKEHADGLVKARKEYMERYWIIAPDPTENKG